MSGPPASPQMSVQYETMACKHRTFTMSGLPVSRGRDLLRRVARPHKGPCHLFVCHPRIRGNSHMVKKLAAYGFIAAGATAFMFSAAPAQATDQPAPASDVSSYSSPYTGTYGTPSTV